MLEKPDIKTVIGKTGSGKTIKALNLVKDADRLVIFDTLGHDYKDGVVFYDMDSFKAFWLKVYKGKFRLIYRPLKDVEEFEEICDLVFECGNITLLTEEMDIFCQPGKTPFSFIQILKRGRHRDIHFVGVTQRPVGIDKSVMSQANEVYVFETNEPRDLDYLKERLGIDAVEKIKMLEPYQWLKWTGRGQALEVGKEQL